MVAIGLGGPEKGFPRADFAPFFARARAAGYDAVAHAGETAGAEHVREAVIDLGARRVQHGVRAVEDEAVLRLLAERKVCCDLALTSNQCLKVVEDVKDHPVRRMHGGGGARHALHRRPAVLRDRPEPRVRARPPRARLLSDASSGS